MIESQRRRDRGMTLAIIFGLLVQMALGMVANLYVTIPAHHPGAHAGSYFSGAASGVGWATGHAPWSLAIHAAFGLVLVVAVVARLALAARRRGRRDIVLAIAGAVFTIGAGFNGASFLNYGHALSSLLMALLFALALAAYAIALD